MIHKLVVGYDLLEFPIAYTKYKAEFLDSAFAICLINVLNHFSGDFPLSLSPLSPRGNKKVIPTRLSGLNPGQGLREVGPSSCFDLISVVGVSNGADFSPFNTGVGF